MGFAVRVLWNVEACRRLACHLVSCEQKLIVDWHSGLGSVRHVHVDAVIRGTSHLSKRPQCNRDGQVHFLRENLPFCSSTSGSSIIGGQEDCVFRVLLIHEEFSDELLLALDKVAGPRCVFNPCFSRFRLNFLRFYGAGISWLQIWILWIPCKAAQPCILRAFPWVASQET
jgi:hypothetical protein